MTPQRRRSRSTDRARPAAALALFAVAAAVAAVGVVTLAPRAAWAQACCVGTGLVTPARLRMFEDYGAGVQTRVRSVMGSFNPGGSYLASRAGNDEVDLEQDFLAAARVGAATSRRRSSSPSSRPAGARPACRRLAAGSATWPANLRYDITFAGDDPRWPGVALLAGLSAPTGRTVEDSADPSRRDRHRLVRGQRRRRRRAGVRTNLPVADRHRVAADRAHGRTGPVADRIVRNRDAVFRSARTGLLAGGYAFANELTLGAFVSAMRRSDQSLVTGGAAVAVPLGDLLARAGDAVGRSAVRGLGPQPAHRRRAHGIAAARLVVALGQRKGLGLQAPDLRPSEPEV